MIEQKEYNVNNPSAIATLVALGALTSFVLIIAPGLVGAFVNELGLTPQQAGYLISADMAGMGLAILPEVAVAADLRRGQLVRISVPTLMMAQDFMLYLKSNRTLSPTRVEFVRFLKEHFKPKSRVRARG